MFLHSPVLASTPRNFEICPHFIFYFITQTAYYLVPSLSHKSTFILFLWAIKYQGGTEPIKSSNNNLQAKEHTPNHWLGRRGDWQPQCIFNVAEQWVPGAPTAVQTSTWNEQRSQKTGVSPAAGEHIHQTRLITASCLSGLRLQLESYIYFQTYLNFKKKLKPPQTH